jgi:hypothetical protein
MRRLIDITKQLTNGLDVEVHTTRGEHLEVNLKRRIKERKAKAAAMLRNDTPNNVFVIARVCHLDVMTVRDLEREYLNEMKRKGEVE